MKKVLKSVLGLCLAVTILFGSGMQVKAAQGDVEWTEGWLYVLQENDYFWVTSENLFIAYWDGDSLGEGDSCEISYAIGDRYVECKLTPEGKRGLYIFSDIPRPKAAPETNAPSCSDHTYEWTTTREATATVAGEKAYQCTKCSHIESYAEVSGYLAFNEDAMKSIKNAAANGTVTIDTKMWISFHKSVFDTLGTRKDVAVTVNFKHEGKNYTTTIPAGADLTGLTDEKGFCGFLILMAKFGGSEVIK